MWSFTKRKAYLFGRLGGETRNSVRIVFNVKERVDWRTPGCCLDEVVIACASYTHETLDQETKLYSESENLPKWLINAA